MHTISDPSRSRRSRNAYIAHIRWDILIGVVWNVMVCIFVYILEHNTYIELVWVEKKKLLERLFGWRQDMKTRSFTFARTECVCVFYIVYTYDWGLYFKLRLVIY